MQTYWLPWERDWKRVDCQGNTQSSKRTIADGHCGYGFNYRTLFESEMFGHVKGALLMQKTIEKENSRWHKMELFPRWDWKSLITVTIKALSVIQNRYITKVGSKTGSHRYQAGCATNCNLHTMVREGSFREDLLYRLNTIQIEVPPLEPVDDIPVLATHFLRVYCEKYNKGNMRISTQAQEKLSNYHWPEISGSSAILSKRQLLCRFNCTGPSDLFSILYWKCY